MKHNHMKKGKKINFMWFMHSIPPALDNFKDENLS
jgi:hypothetical protein